MKTYRVHGNCIVPCEAEIVVEARDANDALRQALTVWAKDKRSLIVSNSTDDGAAYDWHPTAEVVPNLKSEWGEPR